jgi:hypothetical protein
VADRLFRRRPCGFAVRLRSRPCATRTMLLAAMFGLARGTCVQSSYMDTRNAWRQLSDRCDGESGHNRAEESSHVQRFPNQNFRIEDLDKGNSGRPTVVPRLTTGDDTSSPGRMTTPSRFHDQHFTSQKVGNRRRAVSGLPRVLLRPLDCCALGRRGTTVLSVESPESAW